MLSPIPSPQSPKPKANGPDPARSPAPSMLPAAWQGARPESLWQVSLLERHRGHAAGVAAEVVAQADHELVRGDVVDRQPRRRVTEVVGSGGGGAAEVDVAIAEIEDSALGELVAKTGHGAPRQGQIVVA